MHRGACRCTRVAAAPADGGEPRRECLAAQRPAHQVHGTCRAHQPAAFSAIGRQHGLESVPRELRAQFRPDQPVALARPLDARGQMMPGQLRERHRVPPQHAVHPVVRRHHVQQPHHGGLLESLTARRVNPDRPAGWNVTRHYSSIGEIEQTFQSIMIAPLASRWPGLSAPAARCWAAGRLATWVKHPCRLRGTARTSEKVRHRRRLDRLRSLLPGEAVFPGEAGLHGEASAPGGAAPGLCPQSRYRSSSACSPPLKGRGRNPDLS